MNILIEKTYADWAQPFTISATNVTGVTSIETLMVKVVGWISLLVGILAFIYLIYCGILYITAAGNPDQAKKGQQGIVNAIIGIVICIFAYTIVNVIANKVSTGTTTSACTSPLPTSGVCSSTTACVAAPPAVCP